MSDATAEELEEEKTASKLPLILGLVLALAGGGGGFYSVQSGLIPTGAEPAHKEDAVEPVKPLGDIAFVPVDPIMISLSTDRQVRHLRFRSQLEVAANYQADVEKILPRIVDVLNGYLRALELADLTDPLALPRMRAQMLRRVQVVAGKGRVRDILIMEFILN